MQHHVGAERERALAAQLVREREERESEERVSVAVRALEVNQGDVAAAKALANSAERSRTVARLVA